MRCCAEILHDLEGGILYRHKKKDLLQTISVLQQANDSVNKAISANEEGLLALLAKCQEAAIGMGNYVEGLGNQYVSIIKILEEYCENLYQLNEVLINGLPLAEKEKEGRKIFKKIRKQLQQLQNAITYNLPKDRKEIVFLPYKASMWDSLESVWKAAEADENADAYVIPIPYYDKNPDGSFREEHYEGGLYPDYVPITRYDEYDFEQRRPDAIFIHNPYDDCNIVTSVHPFFYSGNLKKYTEQLIYIPYFVLGEVDPENDSQIKNIEHFCTVPGVFNADKIIVQSENMRRAYINILKGFVAEQGAEEIKWESKILALGSPKMDKVLYTRREELDIPTEWKRIIKKADGSCKKIIFYNTSVNGILQHGEKMISKIREVLEVFWFERNEIALLWRPHPLMEATIKTMRPELLDGYMEIVEKFKLRGYGIYDDSADVDRAVILCDAYYGDYSSIVYMCREAGKPIMIQNVEVGM